MKSQFYQCEGHFYSGTMDCPITFITYLGPPSLTGEIIRPDDIWIPLKQEIVDWSRIMCSYKFQIDYWPKINAMAVHMAPGDALLFKLAWC